jgi:ATP-dependent DNA ligase
MLDGELVVWDGQHLDFTALQRRMASPARARSWARTTPASYVAFDVLHLKGRDLTVEPLRVAGAGTAEWQAA